MKERNRRLTPHQGDYNVYWAASDEARRVRQEAIRKSGANAEEEEGAATLCEIFLKEEGERAVRLYYQSAASHADHFAAMLPITLTMLEGTQLKDVYLHSFLPKVAEVAGATPTDTPEKILKPILLAIDTPLALWHDIQKYGKCHPGLYSIIEEKCKSPDDFYALAKEAAAAGEGLGQSSLLAAEVAAERDDAELLEDMVYYQFEEDGTPLDLLRCAVEIKDLSRFRERILAIIEGAENPALLYVLLGRAERIDVPALLRKKTKERRSVLVFSCLALAESETLLEEARKILYWSEEAYGRKLLQRRCIGEGQGLPKILTLWRGKLWRKNPEQEECLHLAKALTESLHWTERAPFEAVLVSCRNKKND